MISPSSYKSVCKRAAIAARNAISAGSSIFCSAPATTSILLSILQTQNSTKRLRDAFLVDSTIPVPVWCDPQVPPVNQDAARLNARIRCIDKMAHPLAVSDNANANASLAQLGSGLYLSKMIVTRWQPVMADPPAWLLKSIGFGTLVASTAGRRGAQGGAYSSILVESYNSSGIFRRSTRPPNLMTLMTPAALGFIIKAASRVRVGWLCIMG